MSCPRSRHEHHGPGNSLGQTGQGQWLWTAAKAHAPLQHFVRGGQRHKLGVDAKHHSRLRQLVLLQCREGGHLQRGVRALLGAMRASGVQGLHFILQGAAALTRSGAAPCWRACEADKR